MDIAELREGADAFRKSLNKKKLEIAPAGFWYPYDILANFTHLQLLLTGDNRDLFTKIQGGMIADIGSADGDTAFFLESIGNSVHIIDNPPTNWNGLAGAEKLRTALNSAVKIHAIDLDSKFQLPSSNYRLAIFLGVLYHLKNPYYALEQLARGADYCLLSTKIARYAPDRLTEIRNTSLAYFLMSQEANNDPTNYWIFSETSLRRIIERCGWIIEGFLTVGDTVGSDPVSPNHDERAFCLLKSKTRSGELGAASN